MCHLSGVPLAPSDILKVLLVSARPQERKVFGLLRGWNACKQDLLKASNDLNKQRGKTFWGKVLASKVTLLTMAAFQDYCAYSTLYD